MGWYETDNLDGFARMDDIPVTGYGDFYDAVCDRLDGAGCHIAHYFAVDHRDSLRLICILADDTSHKLLLRAFDLDYYGEEELESIAARHPQAHPFERAITEAYGIRFVHSPWDKPLRFPHQRMNRKLTIDRYPFYEIQGEALHEVTVGPIHAGIIEPGAFRFVCNGEKVLHLEISLGYQHRGIESLITATDNRLRQTVLCESVAGDSAVGHATAYAMAAERLSAATLASGCLDTERALALEMERIAMHIADTGALCADIAYQTGQVACEALRTLVINSMQKWCGNRFGKGLIRPGGTWFPLTEEMNSSIRETVSEVVRRYDEVREDLKGTQSVMARFEECGTVGARQMERIGAVGPAARASGLARDVRSSHPWGPYAVIINHRADLKTQGDVMARLMLRGREVFTCEKHINRLLDELLAGDGTSPRPDYELKFQPDSLSVSLVEGWRGEICHVAVSNGQGGLAAYRIKDPSLHNWHALALAVRGEGISDFPICNKSFNLSYCGHDL